MNILKFSGTSVGSANRIKEVAKLVQLGDRKIVVLSAMSGTTNSLVEIAGYLFQKKNNIAADLIEGLRAKYKKEINELFSNEKALQTAEELIKSHFDFLLALVLPLQRSFCFSDDFLIPSNLCTVTP